MRLAIEFLKAFIFSRRAGSLVRRLAYFSVFGISVSTTAFFVVLFVMNGMNATIRERILALEPHVSISAKTDPQLKDDSDVEYFSLAERQDIILRTLDGQFRGAEARGYDSDGYRRFLKELFRLAKISDDETMEGELEPDEIIVGIDLARSMNLIEGDYLTALSPEALLLPVGQTPKVAKLRVRRIITTQLADLDSKMVLYAKGTSVLSQLSQGLRKQTYQVWLKSFQNINSWAEKKREQGLELQTWTEQNSALFFALKLEKTMIGIFLGLAGLISGFSILTVMSLLISQKRRDISLMRVVGFAENHLRQTFVRVGFILGGMGVFCGAMVGLFISLWIQLNPINILPDIYYDSQVPSKVDPTFFMITLVMALIVCFIGAFIPVRQIMRTTITEGLRRS